MQRGDPRYSLNGQDVAVDKMKSVEQTARSMIAKQTLLAAQAKAKAAGLSMLPCGAAKADVRSSASAENVPCTRGPGSLSASSLAAAGAIVAPSAPFAKRAKIDSDNQCNAAAVESSSDASKSSETSQMSFAQRAAASAAAAPMQSKLRGPAADFKASLKQREAEKV